MTGLARLRRVGTAVAALSVAGRLVLSMIAVTAIVAILYQYVFQTSSIDAVISGQLIEITAPISGRVDFLHVPTGQILPPRQIFAVIVDDRADDRLLQELSALRDRNRTAFQSLNQELTTLNDLKDRFTHRAAVSHNAERSRLETLLAQSESVIPSAQAQLDLNRAEQDRVALLVDQGEYHPVKLLDAKKNAEQAESELHRLEMIVAQSKAQLAALDKGSVIGEGFDDAPYSQQRLDDILVRIAEVTAARDQTQAEMDAAETRLDAEEVRLEKSTKALLSTAFRARVWSPHTSPGVELRESAPVVDFVDCDNLFVEATLPERFFDRIKVGGSVLIRPYGADHDLRGSVRAIRGNGAPTSLTQAASLERSAKKIMTVDIDFLTGNTAELTDCPVGRSATVTFQ